MLLGDSVPKLACTAWQAPTRSHLTHSGAAKTLSIFTHERSSPSDGMSKYFVFLFFYELKNVFVSKRLEAVKLLKPGAKWPKCVLRVLLIRGLGGS